MDDWKNWEGRIIDQQFRLLQNISAKPHSGVFLTAFQDNRAAIKLVLAEGVNAEDWSQSTVLQHPHLLRVYQTGIDDDLLYAVMEVADEDLSAVLPERALSEDEVRDVLPPVLKALEYLHKRNLVHGRLKPSNIMAAGDQVKLSSDGLSRAGQQSATPQSAYDAPEISATGRTPASDVFALGVSVVEMLTQVATNRPDYGALPARFANIVRPSLEPDPRLRPSVGDIEAMLRGAAPAPPAKAQPVIPEERARAIATSRRNVALLAGAALVMASVIMVPRVFMDRGSPAATPVVVSPPPNAATPAAGNATAAEPSPGEVLQRAMPDIDDRARRSIRGRIRMTVRVNVDELGSVTEARLESRGASRYFSERVLQAARKWKFKPPVVNGRNAPSQWVLGFELTRSDTKVTPRSAKT